MTIVCVIRFKELKLNFTFLGFVCPKNQELLTEGVNIPSRVCTIKSLNVSVRPSARADPRVSNLPNVLMEHGHSKPTWRQSTRTVSLLLKKSFHQREFQNNGDFQKRHFPSNDVSQLDCILYAQREIRYAINLLCTLINALDMALHAAYLTDFAYICPVFHSSFLLT